jgi:DNA-binding transcriptional MerR regulator/methylmalonyl-CoA mutase cobalamin-binding subunit
LPDTLYSLTQIVELADIPSQTIYAWERRYNAVVPLRTSTGRRIYTRTQLQRLKLLKTCVEQGHRIGSVAHMSDASLRDLISAEGQRPPKQRVLLDYALAFEQDELDARIGLALISLGPAAFADDVLAPLMAEIGHRWKAEPDIIIAEHLITAAAKSILFAALRFSRSIHKGASAVFATPEGDNHELGLLACALVAQNCGVNATYLGSQMPVAQIPQIVAATQSQYIVVASSISEPRVFAEQVAWLRQAVPKGTKIVAGGQSTVALKDIKVSGVVVLDSVRAFAELLTAEAS